MLDILFKRRSIRRYKSKAIEREKVDSILKAALLSPSSRGIRPWEFIVVTDRAVLYKLSQCRKHGSAFLKDAPLGIVVLAHENESDVWVEDASIASIIMQLEAQVLGLGSCWIQIRNRMYDDTKTSEKYIRDVLSIPDGIRVESIISIGYPDEEKSPHSEDELDYDKIYINRYGN
ncbi:MAG TPA: hypothetical protein GX392_00730 [Clostridiales bacterium]|nr:hypothetical protein [Clostridiales bacterium]